MENSNEISNREAFLRDRAMLLEGYNKRFVVYIEGGFKGDAETYDELVKKMREVKPLLDIYVEQVNKKAFEESGSIDMTGLHEII